MSKRKLILIAFLVYANFVCGLVAFELGKSEILKVVFLDVGQGDSILVILPQGDQLLIDTGPYKTGLSQKISNYLPFWDKKLELVILTHQDKDHVSGFEDVIGHYQIETLLTNEVLGGKDMVLARAGQKIIAGQTVIEVISPLNDGPDGNDDSVVVKITYKNRSFLLTGDLEKKGEFLLLDKDIDSDVLKIGHHGSSGSSSEEFLARVSPELAVISVGKNNNYGHPSLEVLERLIGSGIRVLRTDQLKDIQVLTDGNALSWKPDY